MAKRGIDIKDGEQVAICFKQRAGSFDAVYEELVKGMQKMQECDPTSDVSIYIAKGLRAIRDAMRESKEQSTQAYKDVCRILKNYEGTQSRQKFRV